ncbi:MAG: hypothetical protein FD123_467 [Bacteroidetes bacterium]|nr:MAG: hypothetical protein FD123_467 [Bacteroidota bacterium]
MKKCFTLFATLFLGIATLKAQTGAALNFNAGNIVTFGPLTNIPIGNSPYTIELLIKPSALNGGFIGWGNYGGTNQINAFRFGSPGTLYAYWWGNDLNPSTSPVNLYDGNWHHVATTFDGTTRAVYVDGCLIGQDNPGSGHNVPSTVNFRIGVTCSFCGGEYYAGSMDELRIWNIARTPCEISAYKNCEIPTTAPGLVANYHFNQGTAGGNNAGVTTLTDASGNSNNGTLTGFTLNGAASNWVAPGGVVSGFSTPNPLSICTSALTNISCNGGSNGSIAVSVGCGLAPYSYDWTPGNPAGDGTATVTGLAAGTWTCTVTDANGAVGIKSFTLTQPTAVSFTVASQTNILCNGGSNGAASVNMASGGAGPYTYNWTPGNPAGDGTTSVTGLTAGTWTCTVTDASSCTATQTFNITQPAVLVASAASQTNISCNGGSNGAASVTVSGGTTAYSYNWTPGNPTGDGTASVTGLASGTWTCTVTDANACIATQTFSITQPTALVVSAASQTNTSCFGTNDGTAAVSASGGTTAYSYNWAPSGGTAAAASGLIAGTYTCTVTDANGCTATTTITITEPTVVAPTSSATAVLCTGGSAGITVVGAGGTSPYTGEGTFTVTAGTYNYTVTDANGCTGTTTITITEPTVVAPTSSATTVLCNGDSADITVVGAGGTSPYTGEGMFTVIAGTYSYTVTDANGCTGTTTITVTEPAAISTSATSVNVSCNGGSDGSIDLTVAGGTGPFTFNWNSGAFTTEDLTGLPAGTYSGILTDANGCIDSGTVVISEPLLLAASVAAAVNPTTCAGTNGSVDITITGGTTGYTYLWSTTASTEDISGLGAGVYSCTITDANGCTTTTSATLNDPNAPAVTLSVTQDTVCLADAALTLSGESPAGGTWSGNGVTGNLFDPATAGLGTHLITYTYMDSAGCTGIATDSIWVDACTGISASAVATQQFTVFPNPNNGTFTLQIHTNGAADVGDC